MITNQKNPFEKVCQKNRTTVAPHPTIAGSHKFVKEVTRERLPPLVGGGSSVGAPLALLVESAAGAGSASKRLRRSLRHVYPDTRGLVQLRVARAADSTHR